MKKTFVVVILCLMATIAFVKTGSGQTPSFNQISVSSPSASALQKFTDYPVSLNTGLIDISIPIYNVNLNGISVPIDLKYHASGIKYDDYCTTLGIGWTLEAGGMITEVIQGLKDNYSTPGNHNFIKDASLINPLPGLVSSTGLTDGAAKGGVAGGDNGKLIDFDRGLGDGEYDIYNFTFPGHSGKFFYPGAGISTPVISPYKKLLINDPRNDGSAFTITDEAGIQYVFGEPEGDFYHTGTINYLLTEIRSADKADTVRFTYNIDNFNVSKLIIADQAIVRDNVNYRPPHSVPNTTELTPSAYYMTFPLTQLTGITFRTGRIEFKYNENAKPGLTSVNIYNNISAAPIRSVAVQQSLFASGSDYYKLDQVDFKDNVQQKSYSQKLAYNGVPSNRLYTGIDYWGYYNNAGYHGSYIPDIIYGAYGYPIVNSMDRRPNELAMQQGMLQKITYPTGGSSVFTFEANRSEGQIAGGLRIQKIDNYDLNGGYLNSKWYKYGENENGDGISYRSAYPQDYCYTYLEVDCDWDLSIAWGSQQQGNMPPPGYYGRKRVFGAFPKFSYQRNGSAVNYSQVTEYSGDGVNANGKTVYSYENFLDGFTSSSTFYHQRENPLLVYSNSWKTGQLLSKQIFNKTGASYNPIYTLTNQYQDFNKQDYQCLKVLPSIDWYGTFGPNTDKLDGLEYFQWGHCPLVYLNLQSTHAYANYYLTTGSRQVTSSTETKDGVTTTTNYTYDPVYLKPVTTTTTKSDGNTILTKLTYPFDLSTAPYTAMVANNIIDPVITKSEFKNDMAHPIGSVTTNYGNWGNLYAPQSVNTQKGNNPAETRLVYDAYDAWGNILQRHKLNTAPECYIWDYKHNYPIASVTGSAASDAAYTSFEADGNGGWNFDPLGVITYPAVTGSKCFDLSYGHINCNTLSASKTYTISYWVKNRTTALGITGPSYATGVKGATINGWTYFEHQVSGATNVQFIGSCLIDELRLYPKDAQMTTYTFNPLVGMTSSTDTKGETTTYEYDTFQRLMNVRDKDGNIIKHTDYHYQGQ